MYTDRTNFIKDYPYDGEFYTIVEERDPNGNLLNAEEFSEVVVHTCKCDIQEASKMFNSGALLADYNVYFELNEDGTTPVRRGQQFRGSVQGMPVGGTVTGLFPTQMGVKATVKEVDVDLGD